MALLWRKSADGKNYEVRSAGASVRLYTNGVFHSQFNERQPITGNLWNMLSVPALLHVKPQDMRRVLVLGVGGGAVLRHVAQIAPRAQIIGVDLDATHLSIARRFFNLSGPNINLRHGEARAWLSQYKGAPFDLIIDDLFGEAKDAQQLPQRALPVTSDWLRLLRQQLAEQGVLAFNLEDSARSAEAQRLAACSDLSFAQAVQISHEQYHNAVLALLPRRMRQQDVPRALAVEPAYRQWQRRGGLPYRVLLRAL